MAFSKRTLTTKELMRQLRSSSSMLHGVVSAYRHQRVEPAFAEKLMLVVTSVLQCRYCNWMHSELALRFGVDDADIEALLNGDLSIALEQERPALAFALSFAASEGRAPKDELADAYPAAVQKDVRVLVDFVTFTNKLGNTFDAFRARFRGEVAPDSSLPLELGVFMVMAPVYAGVALFTRKGRNALRARPPARDRPRPRRTRGTDLKPSPPRTTSMKVNQRARTAW